MGAVAAMKGITACLLEKASETLYKYRVKPFNGKHGSKVILSNRDYIVISSPEWGFPSDKHGSHCSI